MAVPCNVIGAIIGKGGETIKKLQQDSGARIQFRPEETDGSPHRMCNISGSRDQISAAMDMMREIMESSSVCSKLEVMLSIILATHKQL
jgi:far upstream element-binding protein